jgi:transposase
MRYYKNLEEFVNQKNVFIGIDIHYTHWELCFICDGEVVEKVRIKSNYSLLIMYLKQYKTAKNIKIVYEAGFSGFWLCRKLIADGYDCMITPPNKAPRSENKVKTDKRDAQKLAYYLSANLLKSVYVPPKQIESDRKVIRRRSQLVKKQTRAKNHIKSFLHLHGIKTPEDISKNWSNNYITWLEGLKFEYESEHFTFSQLIRCYRYIRNEILELTKYLRNLSRTDKYYGNFNKLTSLRGIGLITAMTYLLELYDLKRFKNEKCFSSYLGFTPSQFSSGEHFRLGHITREGNAHLRRVLIESAWTVIKHDPFLRDKYERIKAKGVNGKKAIVAVARSLAVRLRRCLLDQTDYVIGVC